MALKALMLGQSIAMREAELSWRSWGVPMTLRDAVGSVVRTRQI